MLIFIEFSFYFSHFFACVFSILFFHYDFQLWNFWLFLALEINSLSFWVDRRDYLLALTTESDCYILIQQQLPPLIFLYYDVDKENTGKNSRNGFISTLVRQSHCQKVNCSRYGQKCDRNQVRRKHLIKEYADTKICIKINANDKRNVAKAKYYSFDSHYVSLIRSIEKTDSYGKATWIQWNVKLKGAKKNTYAKRKCSEKWIVWKHIFKTKW